MGKPPRPDLDDSADLVESLAEIEHHGKTPALPSPVA